MFIPAAFLFWCQWGCPVFHRIISASMSGPMKSRLSISPKNRTQPTDSKRKRPSLLSLDRFLVSMTALVIVNCFIPLLHQGSMVTAIVRRWASPQYDRTGICRLRFRLFREYEPLPFRAFTTRGLNTGDRTAAASAFLRLNITPSVYFLLLRLV